ncbi:MAG: PaaI family thioesterase [Cytophagales bacterium]|nr:MAG: PaaI family thioesterase [Cytophagales bacterium]
MSKLLEILQASIGKQMNNFFAPPLTQWLAGTLLKAEHGEVEMSFVVRNEMTNPAGMLHGGIHAAILDDIIGMNVASLGLPNLYVSVNLSIDFLAPARVGEVVISKTKIIRAGKTIVNATAEIYNEKGILLSKATSNLANTGLPAPM